MYCNVTIPFRSHPTHADSAYLLRPTASIGAAAMGRIADAVGQFCGALGCSPECRLGAAPQHPCTPAHSTLAASPPAGNATVATLFAPTDEAFAAIGDQALQDLLDNPAQLADILKYHVIVGKC